MDRRPTKTVTWSRFDVLSLHFGKRQRKTVTSIQGDGKHSKKKNMDSRGIEPRTTPRIEFEAPCASEMLREYYTTKPRARGLSCYSFDVSSDENSHYVVLEDTFVSNAAEGTAVVQRI